MLTRKINRENIGSVRHQISQKLKNKPYFATMEDARSVVTDMDHYPYTRFFRGVYNKSQPVVFEREAGWRPIRDYCYAGACPVGTDTYPNNCFEAACSTTLPCYPERNINRFPFQLNDKCILEYR
jgi:hypothetical protein